MLEAIKRFARDEDGPTAVEYALMVAGIALVIAGAVYFFGGKVSDSLKSSNEAMLNPP